MILVMVFATDFTGGGYILQCKTERKEALESTFVCSKLSLSSLFVSIEVSNWNHKMACVSHVRHIFNKSYLSSIECSSIYMWFGVRGKEGPFMCMNVNENYTPDIHFFYVYYFHENLFPATPVRSLSVYHTRFEACIWCGKQYSHSETAVQRFLHFSKKCKH